MKPFLHIHIYFMFIVFKYKFCSYREKRQLKMPKLKGGREEKKNVSIKVQGISTVELIWMFDDNKTNPKTKSIPKE